MNFKISQLDTLPLQSEHAHLYVLSNGEIHLGKSNGEYLQLAKANSEIEYVTTLPIDSIEQNKIYLVAESDSFKLYIHNGTEFIEASKKIDMSDVDGLIGLLDGLIATINGKADSTLITVLSNRIDSHELAQINSESGLHNIRLWDKKIQEKLEDGTWVDAITSIDLTAIEDELNTLIQAKLEGLETAPLEHTHEISHVTELQTKLDEKVNQVDLDYTLENYYENITQNILYLIERMDTHELGLINSENGLHGVRIWNGKFEQYDETTSAWIELSSTVKSHTHLISEIANLQTTLDTLRVDVDKKAELPITANQVNETSDKVFVSFTQRSQITSNTSAIDINAQRIQNLEDSIGVVTSTDEKVKMNANDTTPSYLEDKIDNSTIQQQNNKLTVPFLNNIVTTSEEINCLQGVTSNIQQQINSLSGVSAFRGVFATLDELQGLSDSQEGEYAIVSDGANSSYYFFYGNQWGYSHETSSTINIDLASTTGNLPKDRYEKQNAQETSVVNTQGNFIGNNVEEVLNELFTLSNSSKNSIVSAIGFPVVNNDTFTQIKTKIEQLKIIFANYLVAHEIPAYPYEPINNLIEKVKGIEAIETTGSTKIKENINVSSVPHIENITLNAIIPMKQFGMSVVEFSEGAKNVEHYNAKFSEYTGVDIDTSNGISVQKEYSYNMKFTQSTGEGHLYAINIDKKPTIIKFEEGK